MLIKHKEQCEQQEITSITTSIDSHLYWRKNFQKNPFYWRIYADIEADKNFDHSNMGIEMSSGAKNSNQRTNIFKQNPVGNGFCIVSELNIILKSGYYETPLGYDNVGRFVDKTIKKKKKLAFFFETSNKNIIAIDGDEDYYRLDNICRFCDKK